MFNVWQLNPDERLKEWRSFRNSLCEQDLKQQLEQVVDWWKNTPLGSRQLDIYDATEWNDPWELLHKGDFDENSIALGMAYSLQLIDVDTQLLLVQNRKNHTLNLIVLVDEQYILNYTYGSIDKVDVLEDCEILQRWSTKNLLN